jgi:hypothetical protein
MLGKQLCTQGAHKRFLTNVNSHMSFQIPSINKLIFSYGTINKFLSNLCFQMLLQGSETCGRLCVQQGIVFRKASCSARHRVQQGIVFSKASCSARHCVQQGINCFFYCRLSRVRNIPICSSSFSIQSESDSSGAFASYKETETVSILLPPFQSLHHI